MNKFIRIQLLLSFFLVACDNSPTPENGNIQGVNNKPHIALVMKTLTNPFFIAMENGARLAEKELNIELIVKTAAQETSISQQIEIVDKLIREKKVKAIVIAPGDSIRLIPVLKKAQDAGILVVNIDNKLDQAFSHKYGLKDVPFISVDNQKGAYLSAKYIADQIKTPSQAAILEGIISASNAQDRKAGAVKAFKENKNITLVSSETANWKIDEAYRVTQTIFNQYPDIKLLFCANDMMALGAIQYLNETKHKDVLVAAYDALDEAKKSIQSGYLQVTIDQQPQKQGYKGIETALSLLNGKKVKQNVLIDVFVIAKKSTK